MNNDSTAVVGKQVSRIGLDPVEKVFLVENHDGAYGLWREAAGKHRILVHVDAHHDMWWAGDPASVTIANFVSLALAEDLVSEVVWVVPDGTWKSARNRRHVVRHARKIVKGYPGTARTLRVKPNQISATVLGKPLRICPVDLLPQFHGEVLLDIDVDYLVHSRVVYSENDPYEALPWCWPEGLLERLSSRGLRTDLVTIAYSVEGGFTPLEWKYLGDELALRLKCAPDAGPNLLGMTGLREGVLAANRGESATAEEQYLEAGRLLPKCAAPLWHLARLYVLLGRPPEARRAYQDAVTLDPSYRTPYDNAGRTYYRNGQLDAAQREFWRIIALNPESAHACLGLGQIAVRRKRWGEAEAFLRRALELDGDLLDGYRALGEVLLKQDRQHEAITVYEQSLKLALAGRKPLDAAIASISHDRLSDPGHWWTYLRLAGLYDSVGSTAKALSSYRMAIAGGHDGSVVRLRLAWLSAKQNDWAHAASEAWRALVLAPVGLTRVVSSVFDWIRRGVDSVYEAWLSSRADETRNPWTRQRAIGEALFDMGWLKSFAAKWRKFANLSGPERRLLAKAMVLLPAMGLALRLFGFQKCHSMLAEFAPRSGGPGRDEASRFQDCARRTARLVVAGKQHGFYRASCLEQSLVLWWFLNRQGIPVDLRIGVRKETQELDAHAWVELNGVVLNDDAEVHRHYMAFDRAIGVQK